MSRSLHSARGLVAASTSRAQFSAPLPAAQQKGKGKFCRTERTQSSRHHDISSHSRPYSTAPSPSPLPSTPLAPNPLISPRRPLPSELKRKSKASNRLNEASSGELYSPLDPVPGEEPSTTEPESVSAKEAEAEVKDVGQDEGPIEVLTNEQLSILFALTTPPPLTALSSFGSRLSSSSLDLTQDLAALERALIHSSFWLGVSFLPPPPTSSPPRTYTHSNDVPKSHNGPLSTLGNTLLGTFATELLLSHYPHLPTNVLKASTTLYVGPKSLAKVAGMWGVGPSRLELKLVGKKEEEWKKGGKERAYGHLVEGRGGARKKNEGGEIDGSAGSGLVRWNRRKMSSHQDAVLQEDAMASVTRAIVGLVYQLHGFSVARSFAHSHILSRLTSTSSSPSASDLLPLLKFDSPTRVLSSTVTKFALEKPVHKLLKESGRLSNHATFLVGVYSGDKKLGEGFGSSLKMSEWRASEDALRRLYLSGGERKGLPSDGWCGGQSGKLKLGETEVAEGSSARR